MGTQLNRQCSTVGPARHHPAREYTARLDTWSPGPRHRSKRSEPATCAILLARGPLSSPYSMPRCLRTVSHAPSSSPPSEKRARRRNRCRCSLSSGYSFYSSSPPRVPGGRVIDRLGALPHKSTCLPPLATHAPLTATRCGRYHV